MAFQPVLDGVLHQRLQQQRRHLQRRQFVRQVQRHLQPRSHADLHQRQVVVQAREFVGQRVFIGPARGQCAAQEGDQPVQHGLGACRVQTDQHAQIGQRVEQHVRLELALQQAQLRLGGLALSHLGAQGLGRGDVLRPRHQHRDHDGQQRDRQRDLRGARVPAPQRDGLATGECISDPHAQRRAYERAGGDQQQQAGPAGAGAFSAAPATWQPIQQCPPAVDHGPAR